MRNLPEHFVLCLFIVFKSHELLVWPKKKSCVKSNKWEVFIAQPLLKNVYHRGQFFFLSIKSHVFL